ncbi:MAG: hypothetical protein SF069_05785 [Phycisphaerae bacterium]|nr:hypothetical protein [Phycisphaerae bacterium]
MRHRYEWLGAARALADWQGGWIEPATSPNRVGRWRRGAAVWMMAGLIGCAAPQAHIEDAARTGPRPVSPVSGRTDREAASTFVRSELATDGRSQVKIGNGALWSSGTLAQSPAEQRAATHALGNDSSAVKGTAPRDASETPAAPRELPEVEVDAPLSWTLGDGLSAAVTIRNLEGVARDYTCYVMVGATANNQEPLGDLLGPQTETCRIDAGDDARVPIELPWEAITPWPGWTQFITINVAVTRVHDQRRWFCCPRIVIGNMPITVRLNVSDTVRIGELVHAKVTYENPFAMPVTDARLTLFGGHGLLIDGVEEEETLTLSSIGPCETGVVERTLVATAVGQEMVWASFFADATGRGDADATIRILHPRLPGDLNCDGFVLADDIASFRKALTEPNGYAAEYPDCDIYNADVNGDEVIDARDIGPFVAIFAGG